MKNFIKLLSRSPLFEGVDPDKLEQLLTETNTGPLFYIKGQMVTLNRNIFDDFLFILRGKIKGELVSSYGKVIRLREVSSPNMLVPAFLFGKNNLFPLNITALTDSEILHIKKESMIKLLQSDKRFAYNFLETISERFFFLACKLEFLNFNTLNKKVAYYLLNLLKPDSNMVKLHLSIKELAEYFGVERPSLSRVIGVLVKQGVIKQIKRQEIEILDSERLMKILED